jgi:hypothetical protein
MNASLKVVRDESVRIESPEVAATAKRRPKECGDKRSEASRDKNSSCDGMESASVHDYNSRFTAKDRPATVANDGIASAKEVSKVVAYDPNESSGDAKAMILRIPKKRVHENTGDPKSARADASVKAASSVALQNQRPCSSSQRSCTIPRDVVDCETSETSAKDAGCAKKQRIHDSRTAPDVRSERAREKGLTESRAHKDPAKDQVSSRSPLGNLDSSRIFRSDSSNVKLVCDSRKASSSRSATVTESSSGPVPARPPQRKGNATVHVGLDSATLKIASGGNKSRNLKEESQRSTQKCNAADARAPVAGVAVRKVDVAAGKASSSAARQSDPPKLEQPSDRKIGVKGSNRSQGDSRITEERMSSKSSLLEPGSLGLAKLKAVHPGSKRVGEASEPVGHRKQQQKHHNHEGVRSCSSEGCNDSAPASRPAGADSNAEGSRRRSAPEPAPSTATGPQYSAEGPPPGWTRHWSKTWGAHYLFNARTGEQQWESGGPDRRDGGGASHGGGGSGDRKGGGDAGSGGVDIGVRGSGQSALSESSGRRDSPRRELAATDGN